MKWAFDFRNALAVLALSASCPSSAADYTLYNVVPMALDHEAEQAAKAVEMYDRTGADLSLYSLTLHPEGVPARAKADRYVASFHRYAEALKGTKVRPAVLVQAILGHWPRTDKENEPWERTIDQDGKTVRYCPMDPGFGAYITHVFTSLAKEHPAFILLDDDVRAYSHGAECFCASHMRLFNERRGTNYTSEGLRAKLAAAKPGHPDYDAFLKMQREMIVECVAGRARAAIDAVDPTIPAGVCIPGEEHYFVAETARRMAAKGPVPVMRAATGNYCERCTAANLPWVSCRMAGFSEYFRGSGIDILCEADTCPQNMWSKSARAFHTHMALSAFFGMKGAKTWYVNGLRPGGAPVTAAYTDVLAENRGTLDAIVRAAEGTSMAGLAIPCFTNHPDWHVIRNHSQFVFNDGNAAIFACAPFGVPYRLSRDLDDRSAVFALTTESEAMRFSDAELETLFAGRVIVFRDAALALTKRGRTDLLGASMVRKDILFNGERDNATGAVMWYSPALSGSVELKPLADGAERLSDFIFRPYSGSPDVTAVAPASVFVKNRLGGEVIVSAYHGRMYGLQQYSEDRKRWFVSLVDRLTPGAKFAVCGNDQDVLTLERRAADGSRLVMAVNINAEPIRTLRIRAGAAKTVAALRADGAWRTVEAVRDGAWLALPLPVDFYGFQVLKITE